MTVSGAFHSQSLSATGAVLNIVGSSGGTVIRDVNDVAQLDLNSLGVSALQTFRALEGAEVQKGLTVNQDLQSLTDHARVKIEANNPAQSGFTAAILELTAAANGGDTARFLVGLDRGLIINTDIGDPKGDNGTIRISPQGTTAMKIGPSDTFVFNTFNDLSDAGLKDEQQEVPAETRPWAF